MGNVKDVIGNIQLPKFMFASKVVLIMLAVYSFTDLNIAFKLENEAAVEFIYFLQSGSLNASKIIQ